MRKLFKFDPDFDPASDFERSERADARSKSSVTQSNLVRQLLGPQAEAVSPRSHVSQKSLVARFMDLDPIAKELFEERAAIIQYEAGLARQEAEAKAFRMVMRAYREANQ